MEPSNIPKVYYSDCPILQQIKRVHIQKVNYSEGPSASEMEGGVPGKLWVGVPEGWKRDMLGDERGTFDSGFKSNVITGVPNGQFFEA